MSFDPPLVLFQLIWCFTLDPCFTLRAVCVLWEPWQSPVLLLETLPYISDLSVSPRKHTHTHTDWTPFVFSFQFVLWESKKCCTCRVKCMFRFNVTVSLWIGSEIWTPFVSPSICLCRIAFHRFYFSYLCRQWKEDNDIQSLICSCGIPFSRL